MFLILIRISGHAGEAASGTRGTRLRKQLRLLLQEAGAEQAARRRRLEVPSHAQGGEMGPGNTGDIPKAPPLDAGGGVGGWGEHGRGRAAAA